MQRIYQCPQCVLRFGLPAELTDHLSMDHPAFKAAAGSIEDDLLGACHCHHRGHHSAA